MRVKAFWEKNKRGEGAWPMCYVAASCLYFSAIDLDKDIMEMVENEPKGRASS